MSAPRLGLPWWGWLLVTGGALVTGAMLVVTVVAGLAGLFSWLDTDLEGSDGHGPPVTGPVDCIQFAQLIGHTDIPAGASAAKCTSVSSEEWHLEATMTVPRADLDIWLSQLPGSPALGEDGCTEAVACVQVDLTQVEVTAYHLGVEVRSEHDGLAEVRMSAFIH